MSGPGVGPMPVGAGGEVERYVLAGADHLPETARGAGGYESPREARAATAEGSGALPARARRIERDVLQRGRCGARAGDALAERQPVPPPADGPARAARDRRHRV